MAPSAKGKNEEKKMETSPPRPFVLSLQRLLPLDAKQGVA
jgi:hypothetical protein